MGASLGSFVTVLATTKHLRWQKLSRHSHPNGFRYALEHVLAGSVTHYSQTEEMMGGRMTMPAEPIGQMRERFRGIWAGVKPMLPPPSDSVQTKDIDYASGRIVRVYVPVNRGRELPVGLYVHSGGWCSGDIEQEDFLCREIALKCVIILFSPEYRLAPENPYSRGCLCCV